MVDDYEYFSRRLQIGFVSTYLLYGQWHIDKGVARSPGAPVSFFLLKTDIKDSRK